MIEIPSPQSMTASKVAAVVLDWAGTTVDFGSLAPIRAILAAFEQAGVPVTETEARQPMGRAKRDHLQAILSQPAFNERWRTQRGASPSDADLDQIYSEFLALQAECVVQCSAVIPGCVEAIAACRERGLKIGSSTGYPFDLLQRVAERARNEGYQPDVMLSADDTHRGRPEPWLIFENAKRLEVFPMSAIVKVDDTCSGVAAGRNAGVWSVGVVASGNEVGLDSEAIEALPEADRQERFRAAQDRLTNAGAHFLIDTIAELPNVIDRIDQRLAAGESP